ncbi:MAG: 2,3-bisphosphoglycerate-independent phosphoglycerate mutase [Bacilli bacterium]|nr:2,3-bisphosphoglycerate-independent phosphoglycerate mutase [Bacilli bacterium]MDD3304967.1 2,3-bisphosphoglycerate-independent phosphoglycerate mutase [Bacilli bacterium]MDD4054080.1 2,3-bisphosphoglycerate-independent phosphoglycerate mutase [Bacilli bacterium]MDD4411400.1 2,3-bisphosphoglycerate-independent phosphoglycerate mutase [Bacilli bacterium]
MKPIVLTILDGVGLRDEMHGNAFKQASKPNYDYLIGEYPNSQLEASGRAVGLPEGQMGNSEVGHLNIGAGRIVYQPLEIINSAIQDGSFNNNKEFLDVINHVSFNNSKLHILGLISDGGIHSHINHIIALLKLAKMHNIKNVYLHCFMDGRDTLPDKALYYLEILENSIKEIGIGKIATISGRYYAMDRDKRWDRLKLAYDALVYGKGPKNSDIKEIINNSFNNNIYDEFIIPTVIDENGMINDNDGVIIANFRPDRVIQMCTALTNDSFEGFETKQFNNLKLVTMMPTSNSVLGTNAFELAKLNNTFGSYISKLSLKQLRIAETEKYAHVTYFFDGGVNIELEGCKRILIDSPKVATYDLTPEMEAYEITNTLIKELDNDNDVVILNFANCDMVGHTGNLEATIKAVEAVDYNLGLIYKKVKELGGILLITGDHGNSEYMLDNNNKVITSHTTNKVPFIICDKKYKVKDGKLCDITPTMLRLMNQNIPSEMTGSVLID